MGVLCIAIVVASYAVIGVLRLLPGILHVCDQLLSSTSDLGCEALIFWAIPYVLGFALTPVAGCFVLAISLICGVFGGLSCPGQAFARVFASPQIRRVS
jgi:hypothetical protein